MKLLPVFRFVLAAVCLGCPVAERASADDGDRPSLVSVEIGFAGNYRVGAWTPAAITLRGGRSDASGILELTLPDSDGVPATFTANDGRPIDIPAGRVVRLPAYVRSGRISSRLSLALRPAADARDKDRRGGADPPAWVVDLPPALPTSRPLIVSVGGDVGAGQAAALHRRRESEREALAEVSDPASLPSRWYGYEGVEVLLLATSRRETTDAIDSERLEALDAWVRMGGRLVLCVGARGEELVAPGRPLERFSPGAFAGVAAQREMIALETFVERSRPLDLRRPGDFDDPDSRPDDRPTAVALTVLTDVRGRVVAAERAAAQSRPLFVRHPRGFGEVVFVAMDLDRPPFAGWPDRGRLAARLLTGAWERRDSDADVQSTGQVVHLGYDDLGGQLHTALEQFSGVTLIPFSVIAVLMVLFMLLVGPGDYFLLRRVVRRMEWTWVSFPLVVLAFCGVSYALAMAFKGGELRVNQLDIVDVDTTSATARVTTWASLYAPRSRTFDLSLAMQVPWNGADSPFVESGAPAGASPSGISRDGALLTWQGLPGSGVGGMNAPGAAPPFQFPYRHESAPAAGPDGGTRQALAGVPVAAWSTKGISSRAWRTAPPIGSSLSHDVFEQLQGTVRNPLAVPLRDGTLYYRRWAYPVESLPPGSVFTVAPQTPRRHVEYVLARRSIQDGREVSSPWDQAALDIGRIAEVMMFHEAAGGRAYTGLLNRYHDDIDLSDQLALGRAVLVGRAESPAARLMGERGPLASPDDGHWTYYRFLYDVRPAGEN